MEHTMEFKGNQLLAICFISVQILCLMIHTTAPSVDFDSLLSNATVYVLLKYIL